MLNGRWTYRSFRDVADITDGDPRAAAALILLEGVLDLSQAPDGTVEGGLGLATGHALRIAGTAWTTAEGLCFALDGTGLDGPGRDRTGRDGTSTAGWRYVFRGIVPPPWPADSSRADIRRDVSPMLGRVLRRAPRDAAGPAVASFIAVRHGDAPPPRTHRPPSPLLR